MQKQDRLRRLMFDATKFGQPARDWTVVDDIDKQGHGLRLRNAKCVILDSGNGADWTHWRVFE